MKKFTAEQFKGIEEHTYNMYSTDRLNIEGIMDLDTCKMIPNVIEVNEVTGHYQQFYTDYKTGKIKELELDGGRCLPRINKQGRIKILWKEYPKVG